MFLFHIFSYNFRTMRYLLCFSFFNRRNLYVFHCNKLNYRKNDCLFVTRFTNFSFYIIYSKMADIKGKLMMILYISLSYLEETKKIVCVILRSIIHTNICFHKIFKYIIIKTKKKQKNIFKYM